MHIFLFCFYFLFQTIGGNKTPAPLDEIKEVSAEYKIEIKKLFHLTGLDNSFNTNIIEAISIYKKQKKQVPPSFWVSLEKELTAKSLDEFVNLFAPIYGKYLDINDVKQVICFYESPAGKKYSANSPKIMKETMLIGQAWAMEIQNTIVNKLIDKGYENKMKQTY